MFVSPTIATIVIALEFIVGGAIGVIVVATVLRSRLRLGIAIRSALLAGIAFLFMMGVSGWAGSHVEFVNGQRQDITSWGENLWLRNRLSEYGVPLGIGSSVVAGLLVSAYSQKKAA